MTTPTPDYSSTAPNTVIGAKPPGLDHAHHLAHMIRGHAALIAEIRAHTEEAALKRQAGREAAAHALIPRREVGGDGSGHPGTAAGR